MESILNSIKKLLGIPAEQDDFDIDVILHINSAFSDLYDIGVGPSEAFVIQDDNDVWESFTEGDMNYENVKQYVYISVKIVFDPPASSAHLTALQNKLKELEWKLQVKAESKQNGEE